MLSTKEKILQSSLALFNTHGLKNTTLQIIANHVQISVGNLAYHYKNKQEIIATHTEELEDLLQEALTHYRNYPNFIDFHIQLEKILTVLNRFPYIFSNVGEMKTIYPNTFAVIQTFHSKLLTQIESRLEYHQNKGTLIFGDTQVITTVAESMTHAILFSQLQFMLVPTRGAQQIHQAVWNMIKPYFSELGLQEWDLLILPTQSTGN